MQTEIYVFIIFILNGILIGLIFDGFRVLRKNFKTPDVITYLEDMFFGISAGILLLYSIMKFNNGEIRVYIFIGIFIGLLLYLLIFSNIFIAINTFFISIVKKTINYIIIIPLKYISKFFKKIIFKPIIFVYINIKNKAKKIKFPKTKNKKNNCNNES